MDVAVIIPVFNKSRHVERAITSALSQTLTPVEIVIVEDASTDGSAEKIAAIKHPLVRIIHRQTPGPGGYAARNAAIQSVGTEWVAFLDADDSWQPNHLQSVSDAISQAGNDASIGCVFTGFYRSYEDGRSSLDVYSKHVGRDEPRRLNFEEFVTLWIRLRGCPIQTSAATFRRQALIKAGLFPAGRCSRGGDKDLWLRAARHADLLACPSVTAAYYQDSANMVTRRTTNVRHCLCDTIEALLRVEPSVERRKLLKRLFNTEVYAYARLALRTQRVDPRVWKGFHYAQDPFRFLILHALSWLPHSITKSYATGASGRLRLQVPHRLSNGSSP